MDVPTLSPFHPSLVRLPAGRVPPLFTQYKRNGVYMPMCNCVGCSPVAGKVYVVDGSGVLFCPAAHADVSHPDYVPPAE